MSTLTCIFAYMAGCGGHESSGGIEYLPDSHAATAPFSAAVRVGDYLYLSGQIGVIPPDARSETEGVEAAARHTMENIRRTLEASGATFDDVFKCTVMLSDIRNWDTFNRVYVTYFKRDRRPARSAFGANGLAMNAAFEVECWAYRPTGHRD
jgi:2-iminobutanoate/2-iminopropanoate deaminase